MPARTWAGRDMLRIELFGQPRLAARGETLHLGGRPKVIPLLAYALLRARAPLARGAVAGALWPDETDSAARANLRRHLHYLAAELPAGTEPWVIATPGTIQWNPGAVIEFDVAEFEAGAAAGDAAAARLYRGDLLAPYDEEWALGERERLRATYLELLASLARSARARRAYGEALAYLGQLRERDPWREDAVRQTMLVQAERGDRAGALLTFECFAALVRDEFDTAPMPETSAVCDAIIAGALPPGAFAPPPAEQSAAEALLSFCGRDSELAALRREWARAAGGRARCIFVGGEAGVGKTRLLREFASRCEAEGGRVLTGSTGDPEAVPYQPFATIMNSVLTVLSCAGESAQRDGLAPILPDFASGAHAHASAGDAPRERIRLFEACASAIRELTERGPVCAILEDLHWAGAATIALLEYLTRRLRDARLLVIATYREDEIDLGHPLRELRRTCERENAGTTLPLGRLDRTAVCEIVARAARGDAADLDAIALRLFERSEGNAFFLGELVRELIERQSSPAPERRWIVTGERGQELPEAVQETVARRLQRLTDAERRVAETAAVAGSAFDVELLAVAMGWSEARILEALGSLVDRHIVAEGERSGFDFTHQLVRAVVYDAIPEGRRRRRHHRIALVMDALYARDAARLAGEIAHHYDRAGERVVASQRYLAAAGRALEAYAAEEAGAHAARALALTENEAVRFDALLVRERIAALRGERPAQARLVDELAALARGLDAERSYTALRRQIDLANVTSDLGLERSGIDALRERALAGGDLFWEGVSWECEARRARTLGEYENAREACDRAIAIARRRGDEGAILFTHLARADTFIFEGRFDEARTCLEGVRTLVDRDRDRAGYVRSLMAFARASLAQHDYAAMSAFAREALEIARAIGDREGEALASHTIANGCVYRFAVAEARAAYEAALSTYREIGHRIGGAGILADFGLFHIEVGLLDRGLALSREAAEHSNEIGYTWTACVANINASYALRLRGEPDAALVAATDALTTARGLHSQQLEAAALGVLGCAASDLGDQAVAVAHLRAGIALRRPDPTPRLGDNLCGLARAHLRAGDLPAARAAAETLATLHREHPNLAPQPAEWLGVCARVARVSGDPAAAARFETAAREITATRAVAIDDDATRAAFLALPFNAALGELSGALQTPG